MQSMFQNRKTIQSYSTFDIFLNPVILSKKNVYISVKNSTIYEELEVEKNIEKTLLDKSYTIAKDPKDAAIVMTANIRYYGVFDRDILNSMLEDRSKKETISNGNASFKDFSNIKKRSRYDIDFSGVMIGAGAGFIFFHTLGAAALGAITVGGSAIALENILESRIVFALIDVQISEKLGFQVKEYHSSQTQEGEGSTRKLEYQNEVDYKTYQTKIVAVAKNANLTDKSALHGIKKQIIANLLALV